MDLITSLGNSLTFHVLFGNYSIDRFFQKKDFSGSKRIPAVKENGAVSVCCLVEIVTLVGSVNNEPGEE